MTDSFWPPNLLSVEVDPDSPVALLKAQATQLREATKGLVEARVKWSRSDLDYTINLELHAPALGYSQALVRVLYGLEMYPLRVAFLPGNEERKCANREDYAAALREFLGHATTRRVIESLIRHIKAQDIATS